MRPRPRTTSLPWQPPGPGRMAKKKPRASARGFESMAERTGLEPATSGVTGQHSNQLNYRSAYCNCYRPTSRPGCHCMQWRVELAERTGLEPATSGVTGQHSNQLNYRSALDCSLPAPLQEEWRESKAPDCSGAFLKLAERTGLEPATSGVTGQHSNQLNYRSTFNTARRCFFVVGAEGFEPPTLSL